MRVNEQIIQLQFFTQCLQAFVEFVDIVAIAHNFADFAHIDAGRDQPQILAGQLLPSGSVPRVEVIPDPQGDVFNLAVAAQIFVQGAAHLSFVEAKEHVNAGRLNVRVHDAHPLAGKRHLRRQVGRGVGFAGSAPE